MGMRLRFNRLELSGGLADLGVLLPIIVVLTVSNNLNPVISLFFVDFSISEQVYIIKFPFRYSHLKCFVQ